MPDITMCSFEECPLHSKCYRAQAKASSYQSYFTEYQFDLTTNKCKFYWLMLTRNPKGDNDV